MQSATFQHLTPRVIDTIQDSMRATEKDYYWNKNLAKAYMLLENIKQDLLHETYDHRRNN